ncbi:putative endonuclease-reverse transcriptase [Trichonephila clavata]|uniref:Putative endonuclease-reverse transcriptase n=1 Tax=Trichonephila clavata TaxID=2740835 RepID=A0A8X6G2K8_TRICU|nr:putative endonuclease-reverse transcriptase [Trichonephila clavata]
MHQKRFTRSSEEDYKTARRNEKRIHKAKKRLFYEELLKDAEHLKSSNESRAFYKIINNSRKDFKSRVTICRNSDGEILSNPTEISQRWVEYFSDLLNAAHTNNAVFVPHQNYQDIQVPPPD